MTLSKSIGTSTSQLKSREKVSLRDLAQMTMNMDLGGRFTTEAGRMPWEQDDDADDRAYDALGFDSYDDTYGEEL